VSFKINSKTINFTANIQIEFNFKSDKKKGLDSTLFFY